MQLTTELSAAAQTQPELPFAVADDYLRAVALALMAWAWARIEATPGAAAPRWQGPAQAFWLRVAPEMDLRLALVRLQMEENAAHDRALVN